MSKTLPGTCEAPLSSSNSVSMVLGWKERGHCEMAPDIPSSSRNQTCRIPVWLSRSSKLTIFSVIVSTGLLSSGSRAKDKKWKMTEKQQTW